MIKYRITHKPTSKSIDVSADSKEQALQIVCSENDFVNCDKNACGWWERKDCTIEEATK